RMSNVECRMSNVECRMSNREVFMGKWADVQYVPVTSAIEDNLDQLSLFQRLIALDALPIDMKFKLLIKKLRVILSAFPKYSLAEYQYSNNDLTPFIEFRETKFELFLDAVNEIEVLMVNEVID
ncbi:MAG: hypothetical protein AAGC78_11470, partial [Cellvibrio sp.]|uniref:hypothetical protein n=1 Tax=Cellvibrio sp. TaxID=1965322 RepID=UPI0031A8E76E